MTRNRAFPFVCGLFIIATLVGFLSPGGAADTDWKERWEKTLAEARREGTVVIYTLAGEDLRAAMTDAFTKRYGIKVELLGLPPPQLAARLASEIKAGQHLADVYVAGTGSMIMLLQPLGAWAPIETTLMLPEVTDTKNWLDEAISFADPKREVLEMSASLSGGIAVNPQNTDLKAIRSLRDLLKPEWKGKIIASDGRAPGTGQGMATFLYINKAFGPEFINALHKQEVVLMRDARQALEWIDRGRYSVLLAPDRRMQLELKAKGLQVEFVAPDDGMYLSTAGGAVSMVTKAPHPNAAKVYINWLLTKEGQTLFNPPQAMASRRLDVPKDYLPAELVPQPGKKYLKSDNYEALLARNDLVKLLKSLWGM